MKLQQLRCLTEVARRGLNVSEAAEALHTSQPGVSKQIKALEDEQGLAGEADFCVATEMIALYSDIVSMPVYQWNRCVVVLPKHPLLKAGALTLEKLAQYPIVTYDFAFANRSLVQKAFEAKGLNP